MRRPWQVRRFDTVEIAMLAAAAFVAGGLLGPVLTGNGAGYGDQQTWTEFKRLRQVYGPSKHSEHEEEWIIRDFFKERRNGVFVDIGANHYRRYNNTYYLERHLAWSGLAVDAQREFAPDYQAHRPRTRFLSFFVSDASSQTTKLYLNANSLVASSTQRFTEAFGQGVQAREVPTVTLTELLEAVAVERIDLLNIDVELAEPRVLAGFAIGRFKPALVCIEAHAEVRQQILDYFQRHGYVVVGRYLRVDTNNLYFQPEGGDSKR